MLLSLVNASLNMGRTGLGVPLPRPCGLPALSGAFGKKWGFFDCWKGFSPCLLTSEGCQNCGEKSEMPKLKLVLLLMEVCSGQPRWVNGTDPAAGCVSSAGRQTLMGSLLNVAPFANIIAARVRVLAQLQEQFLQYSSPMCFNIHAMGTHNQSDSF